MIIPNAAKTNITLPIQLSFYPRVSEENDNDKGQFAFGGINLPL